VKNQLRVRTDPGAAYPETARLRQALATGDWRSGRAVFDTVSVTARTTLMRTAEDAKRADRVLEHALADDPADSTAAAMLGFHRIAAGWRIRSSARAHRVSRQRFARFHSKLREAEMILGVGLSHTPNDPALWTASITTARGLELGLHEARLRYNHLAAIDPHHLPAQTAMLQQLCPKWGGSWDQAHAFAHEAMRNTPAGAPNAVLVADAHLEHFLDAGRRYMRSPHVRDDIAEAARSSVLHPDFRREPGWVQVMNTFAMAFSLIGDRSSAATMFSALGPYVTVYPWAYQGDGIAAFRRSRALASGWSVSSAVDWLLVAGGAVARRGGVAILGMAWR
jgi:hypothetical protein